MVIRYIAYTAAVTVTFIDTFADNSIRIFKIKTAQSKVSDSQLEYE